MTSVTGQDIAGESYSGFAKLLHWVIAVMILGMIPVGIIMHNLEPSALQNQLYNLHRSFGVVVLALMLIRVVYRFAHGVPAPEPSLPPFQRVVSNLVHLALYALVISQAFVGWIATSAFGAPISVFGLFVMPDLVAKDQALAGPLFDAHYVMGLMIAGLLVLHIGAALFHYFVRRDGVMRRMLP